MRMPAAASDGALRPKVRLASDLMSPPPDGEESVIARAEPGSYRDRNGAVFYRDGRVFRGISEKALANFERLRAAPFFAELTEAGSIVRTETADGSGFPGDWAAVLEHARVPFVSYPYEWTFGMLKDAALLHLELMRRALEAGMILKDSSAYNV